MLLDCHGYICRQTTLTHKTEGIFSLLHFKQETKQTVGNKQTKKRYPEEKGWGEEIEKIEKTWKHVMSSCLYSS